MQLELNLKRAFLTIREILKNPMGSNKIRRFSPTVSVIRMSAKPCSVPLGTRLVPEGGSSTASLSPILKMRRSDHVMPAACD